MSEEEKNDVLKKLLFYMESDSKMGHIGIPERLGNIEKRVGEMENRHKVIYRVGVVAGVFFGGVITWVIKLKGIL